MMSGHFVPEARSPGDCPSAGKTLYLCYFGLREPLVQTQVLPYLRQLSRAGIEVHLLTFEPDGTASWGSGEVGAWKERLDAQGIQWLALRYHKRPSLPATAYDVAAGAWIAARLIRRHRIDVLHARGHVAATTGALAKRLAGGRLIFDIRGFLPEEYVDAGIWGQGSLSYRIAKLAEKSLLRGADGFVVLTQRARELLFAGCLDTDEAGRPIEVIPCCVDLERFQTATGIARAEVRRELGLEGRRVLVYVGALGGWYLTDELVRFLSIAHRQDPGTFSLILTQSQPEMITEPLGRLGIAAGDSLVRRVAPSEIPRYVSAADLAVSFIKPCYSKLASSPTKLAEYLACGVPIICNAGIGDVDAIIEADRIGVLVRQMDERSYLRALNEADTLRQDPETAERCRATARDRFDLERVGGVRYQRLYERVMMGAGPAPSAAEVRP